MIQTYRSDFQIASGRGKLYMVDWSEIGVWEPMTDIGQAMISDVKPQVWRDHDRDLIRSYWNRLVSNGVNPKQYTFEQCWQAYQRGGVERWILTFGLLCGLSLPDSAVQYFHDQLLTFIEDHGDFSSYLLKPVMAFSHENIGKS